MNYRELLDLVSTSLVDLIDSDSQQLMFAMNPELQQPTKLRQFIYESISLESILLDQKKRNLILRVLPKDTAEELAILLGNSERDPYKFLLNNSFSNSSQKKILFNFFNLDFVEEIKEVVPSVVNIKVEYGLFDHQIAALSNISKILDTPKGRVMLHMPTGSGKTRTAISYACEYLRKKKSTVIWLASQEELCEQAYSEFLNAWSYLGNRSLDAIRLWGSHKEPKDFNDGFIVIGLDKAFNIYRKNSRFLQQLPNNALIIFDEAHQAIAPTYSQVTEYLINPMGEGKLLGLSATPGRSLLDMDEDKKLVNFFKNKKVTLDIDGYDSPISYLIDQQYLAKPEFITIEGLKDAELTNDDLKNLDLGKDLTNETLKRLGRDDQRNLIIISECLKVMKKHKRVIVFASSVEQSNALAAAISSDGFNAVSISAKTDQINREKFIKEYKKDDNEKKVIFNYGILTTGFDAPKTSAVIITRPTSSLVLYSQMVGRALRGKRAGGNLKAEIYTVMDGGINVFKDIQKAFENWEDVWTNE